MDAGTVQEAGSTLILNATRELLDRPEMTMRYRVKNPTALREAPAPDGKFKRTLDEDTDVSEGIESEDRKWLKVDFGKRDDQKGFVLAADCVDKAGEPRRPIEPGAVVDTCVTTEFRFNAADSIKPWYVLADFVIARSIIETGITNAGSLIPGSDAVGPMQVSKTEWSNFVDNGKDLVRNKEESDRQDPIRQIDAAAFRMHSDTKAMSALRTAPDANADPFAPSLLDAFFAYLTDSPKAALAIRDANQNAANRGQPVSKFLQGALTDAEVTALHKARVKFFGVEATAEEIKGSAAKRAEVKSLGDVVDSVTKQLGDALKQAFDKIKEFIPEAIAVSSHEEGGVGSTFATKAPDIIRKLIATFAFEDFQAAGILGNFGRETGGFTLFQEQHPRSGKGGIGWAQWTGTRRTDFEKFCSDKSLDPRSDEGNFQYLEQDLKTPPESKVVGPLKAATSLEQAARTFMTVYERPGVEAFAERVMWARRALDAFKGVGTVGTVAQKLKEKIATGVIKFDSPILASELLGLNTGTKVTARLQSLVLKLTELVEASDLNKKEIRISSLVRSGSGSHHTEGRAVDIGNEEIAGKLLPVVATDAQVAALQIDELIFDAKIAGQADRNTWNYNQGKKHDYNEATLNQHGNHIHFAVQA